MTDVNLDGVLATAGAILGTELSDPVDLGGSSRSTVLRVTRADGGTAIVKNQRDRDVEAMSRFAAEAAGLVFAERGPELLGADPDTAVLVMSDLGDWPSLADVLLGEDPNAATETLLAWARTYAGIARDSQTRSGELTALLARYGGTLPNWNDSPWMDERLPRFPALLATVGAEVPAGLGAEIATLGDAVHPGPRVFSPGDICPDNNLLTDKGFRVIDFEGAGFHSAYLDVAYVTMPFATCWCVYRLPGEVAELVERAYWTELTGTGPSAADRAGTRAAVAAWTLDLVAFMLPQILDADAPMHTKRRPISTKRQAVRHRLRLASTRLSEAGEFPAIAEAFARLLAFTDRWETPELGLYPAFA
ncbi:phosphotransferase [Phytomonospora endophytica]|uniref:Aminoglycoside/choline kinase family phosphotransferase n=1 Tax=Phytomonospora endophytica TaxID=714109 RepID=A0A841FNP7_9ACTN|nr:phosphotransferase [Phytomonospora endophytica]MBB6037464.1 aminoglycoside/choline kinase family phosphotransferase [Phytomonospora endophytica]GIG70714.1 hypothetical protein Pen01_70090 [Phytomonospora endophytica]